MPGKGRNAFYGGRKKIQRDAKKPEKEEFQHLSSHRDLEKYVWNYPLKLFEKILERGERENKERKSAAVFEAKLPVVHRNSSTGPNQRVIKPAGGGENCLAFRKLCGARSGDPRPRGEILLSIEKIV